MRACYWPGEIAPLVFKDLEKVTIRGQLRFFNNGWLVNIKRIGLLQSESENPVRIIPRSFTPLPALLEKLEVLLDSFTSEVLRQFVSGILADDSIAFPFVSLPASSRHHHCTGSGILEHSLECVAMVSRFEEFPQAMRELAMTAALLHDIGKIRTVRCQGKHTLNGYVLNHDALTLEVLANHLQMLDASNPEIAASLRYLWTWRNFRESRKTPLLTVAEAIAAADRISTGLNVEEQAFCNQPEWKRFAKFNGRNTLWRPRVNDDMHIELDAKGMSI